MGKWRTIDKNRKVFEYRGFQIRHTTKNIKLKLRNCMFTSKKLIEEGGICIISIKAQGSTFEEVKQKICDRIDTFMQS